MRSISFLAKNLLLAAAAFAYLSTSAAAAEITYLANEGFLLAGGGQRVLVDALFGDGLEGYEVVPEALRARLEAAQPPFDGVDLSSASPETPPPWELHRPGRQLVHRRRTS